MGSWSGHLRTPEEDAKRLEAARCRAALPTANARGEALLLSLLTPAQQEEFRLGQYITERRAGRSAQFSPARVFEPGLWHCIYPRGLQYLFADVIVANLLLWRADPALVDQISKKQVT